MISVFLRRKSLGHRISSEYAWSLTLYWNNTSIINSENLFSRNYLHAPIFSVSTLSPLKANQPDKTKSNKIRGLIAPLLPHRCKEMNFQMAAVLGWHQITLSAQHTLQWEPASTSDNSSHSGICKTSKSTQIGRQIYLLCNIGSALLMLAVAWHSIQQHLYNLSPYHF